MEEDAYPKKTQFFFGESLLTAMADRVDSVHSNVLRLSLVRSRLQNGVARVLDLLPLPKFIRQFVHRLVPPQCRLPNRVILKTLKPDWDEEFANEKALYTRLAPLQDSILPTFLGDAEHGGSPAILLSCVEGATAHRQDPTAAMAGEEFGRQVEAILWAFTEFGIGYGDVKLDNFIISPAGRVVLVDLEKTGEVEEQDYELAVLSLVDHAMSQYKMYLESMSDPFY